MSVMPGQQQKSKGNPASKRMGNEKLKARRSRSWARGLECKQARIKKQREQEAHNRSLREQGLPTIWEARVRARRERRRREHLANPCTQRAKNALSCATCGWAKYPAKENDE